MNRTAAYMALAFLLCMSPALAGETFLAPDNINQTPVSAANPLPVTNTPGTGDQPVSIDQTTPGTTNGVAIAPSSAAGIATSNYSSPAAESGHIIKASAGNVYSVYAFSTAAGLFMVFNSATVPTDGAVTPIECIPVSANNFGAHDVTIPDQYGTGISVALSTGTNCFSKTASATAFFKVRYK